MGGLSAARRGPWARGRHATPASTRGWNRVSSCDHVPRMFRRPRSAPAVLVVLAGLLLAAPVAAQTGPSPQREAAEEALAEAQRLAGRPRRPQRPRAQRRARPAGAEPQRSQPLRPRGGRPTARPPDRPRRRRDRRPVLHERARAQLLRELLRPLGRLDRRRAAAHEREQLLDAGLRRQDAPRSSSPATSRTSRSDGGRPSRRHARRRPRTDVYLKELNGRRRRCTATPRPTADWREPVRVPGDRRRLRTGRVPAIRRRSHEPLEVTAAHEYNHVLQYGYDIGQDTWMFESTATWAEEKVFPGRSTTTISTCRPGPPAQPAAHLAERDGRKMYGSAIWNHWLEQRYDAATVIERLGGVTGHRRRLRAGGVRVIDPERRRALASPPTSGTSRPRPPSGTAPTAASTRAGPSRATSGARARSIPTVTARRRSTTRPSSCSTSRSRPTAPIRCACASLRRGAADGRSARSRWSAASTAPAATAT